MRWHQRWSSNRQKWMKCTLPIWQHGYSNTVPSDGFPWIASSCRWRNNHTHQQASRIPAGDLLFLCCFCYRYICCDSFTVISMVLKLYDLLLFPAHKIQRLSCTAKAAYHISHNSITFAYHPFIAAGNGKAFRDRFQGRVNCFIISIGKD